ncbi:hypothetical protein [Arsenophonus endosymbiont of Aleurodicus floccissimus]|uniref:hypothetical protein n=1 Tax=Arsenophonus endosymbiont of Aleurodicus floccissimus TaxID=2152761 RepID=UPI001600BB4D|nr:hypothetical protein [Arsenophonus endosymbiont of Aleurodicus floccissimus]
MQSRAYYQWLVSLLSLSCGLFFLFNTTLVESATLTNITPRQTIQNQLNALNNRSNLTAYETLALSDYKKAIQFYDELAGLEKQTELIQKRVMQAPREARYALDNLAKIKRDQQQNEPIKTEYQHLLLSQLKSQLKNKLEMLQNQQENMGNINNNLVALQTQLERAMNIMLGNAQRLQDIRYQLNNDFSSNVKILCPLCKYYYKWNNYICSSRINFNNMHYKLILNYRMRYRNNRIIQQLILS